MTPRYGPLERHAMTALVVLVTGVATIATLAGAARPLGSTVKNPHGSFREACELCHTADGWRPARVSAKFDHAKFGFPLSGAHAAAGCLGCHGSLEFAKAERLCASCHEDPHRGEMGSDCARCHGARSFLDRAPMVRGHQLTAFPLTGSHAGLDCESCHPPAAQGHLRFVGTRSECEACHLADFRATTYPDHEAGGFPQDCRACHSTLGWQKTNFDHAGTAFPLTGRHRATACASCHASGYAGTPTACVSCHRADYDTASPNHAANGFSTDCATCHNTNGWDGANFNHAVTGFALTGAHTSTPCASCHASGYAGTPTSCVSCHQADFDGTTDPNHAAAQFTTACETCHNTTTFAGARFDHDTANFPIYSGRHASEWNACSDCHTNPANFTVFTCLSCHPHSDRAKTDGAHTGENGYAYDSNACYNCHPRGTH